MTTRKEYVKNCKVAKTLKKSTGLSIVVTFAEREQIRKAANEIGLNITNYIKSRLFYD